ncbi:MAG: hypothetical protein Sapg2KO_24490 [Saprospiraceae bacterium]
MRRKDKHIVEGIVVGATATSCIDILLQWAEHRNTGRNFTWESYNGIRTLKRATIGATIGGFVGYSIYQNKVKEEAKLPFNSDNYLKKILTEESLKSNTVALNKVLSARNKIKNFLWDKFKSELIHFPEDTGSFFKRTALASGFDLDIILPFKKSSFQTLERMYCSVYEVLGTEFGEKATVSMQTKAIGLSIFHKGDLIHFDIVPGREINNYKIDRDLNLYVKPNWIWQREKRFKTNSRIQKRITVNSPKARSVVKLLKKYNNVNRLDIPTTIIEQYTIKAMAERQFGICYSDTDNLLNTMSFISNKIVQGSLVDAANSNNNLLEKISYQRRKNIANQLIRDIERVENNPRYIKDVFE